MAIDYANLAIVSARLMSENGRAVTLTGLKGAAADADKPWDGPTDLVGTPLPLFGVFVPPNTVRQFGITSLGQGTEWRDMVNFSEQIMITFPGETDIRNYTTLVDGGVNWGILATQLLKPASVTLLAFIGVRR